MDAINFTRGFEFVTYAGFNLLLLLLLMMLTFVWPWTVLLLLLLFKESEHIIKNGEKKLTQNQLQKLFVSYLIPPVGTRFLTWITEPY
jgi:cellulose synthase/poly-beta-1,6-N-acetylglucosamine synthase-like glycosyltransferase